MSRGAAEENSLGREPQDCDAILRFLAPKGRHGVARMAPCRRSAAGDCDGNVSRGSRPWLFHIAAPRLRARPGLKFVRVSDPAELPDRRSPQGLETCGRRCGSVGDRPQLRPRAGGIEWGSYFRPYPLRHYAKALLQCGREDLNLHSLRNQILSLFLRLHHQTN